MIPAGSLFRLAFRNVRRHKRRTVLSFLAITVGIAGYLVSSGLINGIDETSIRNFINTDTAHLKIQETQYFPDRKDLLLENLIPPKDVLTVRNAAGRIPGLSATPRLKFRGTVINGDLEVPVTVVGIDPLSDMSVFTTTASLTGTNWNGAPDALGAFRGGSNVCLLGSGLAKNLEVGPGDEILLYGRTLHGAYNADSYVVGGLLYTENPAVDSFSVVLPLRAADIFADSGGAVSEIDLRTGTRDPKTLENIRTLITPDLPPGTAAFTWEEDLSDVMMIFAIRRLGQKIVVTLILLIAVTGIANTMLMAVMERMKEIGTLSALGMKRREIVLLFLFEGAILGFLGSVLAMVITAPPILYFSVFGMPVIGTDLMENIPFSGRLYWNIEFFRYPVAFGIAVLTAVIATVTPSLRAARMNISESLRSR